MITENYVLNNEQEYYCDKYIYSKIMFTNNFEGSLGLMSVSLDCFDFVRFFPRSLEWCALIPIRMVCPYSYSISASYDDSPGYRPAIGMSHTLSSSDAMELVVSPVQFLK